MGFLTTLLNRPANERPYLILVTGYPAQDTQVPAIAKKPFVEITTFI
jgi:hypothetical protein